MGGAGPRRRGRSAGAGHAAASTSRRGPGAAPSPEPRPIWELTPEQERDVMGQALARVQEAQPDLAQGRPDPPPGRTAARRRGLPRRRRPPRRCWSTWPTGCWRAARASRCWRWKRRNGRRCRTSLRRADGRSVYRPHSATRYATLAQLTMEERLTGPGAAGGRAAPCACAGGSAARRRPGSAGGSAPAQRGADRAARRRSRRPARGCAWTRPPPRSWR